MVERALEKTIKSRLNTGKAIVLLGARQVDVFNNYTKRLYN